MVSVKKDSNGKGKARKDHGALLEARRTPDRTQPVPTAELSAEPRTAAEDVRRGAGESGEAAATSATAVTTAADLGNERSETSGDPYAGFTFHCLTVSDVDAHWDKIAPLLQRAIDKCHGETNLDGIAEDIAEGRCFVAVMVRHDEIVLALTLRPIYYKNYSVLDIGFLAGQYSGVFFRCFFHIVRAFARDVGCRQLQCNCGEAETRLFLKHVQDAVVTYRTLRAGV